MAKKVLLILVLIVVLIITNYISVSVYAGINNNSAMANDEIIIQDNLT